MIRWFARNDLAANLVMIAILVIGTWVGFKKVPLEVQPTLRFDEVRVNVEYRGGSPDDVERNVIIPIERALEGLSGIDELQSRASSGSGEVRLRLEKGTDTDKMRDEVETRVAAISSFPQEIEPPRIQIPDTGKWFDVIKVAITGDMDQEDLVRATRRVRDDLVELPGISQVATLGETRPEISIEADLGRLRDFGLSFSDVTEAVQRSSVDLPAGQIQTDEGNLTIRSKGQAFEKEQFESIVLRNSSGAEVRLRDVARVSDGFEENRKLLRFNGRPALLVEALRLNQENALDIATKVKDYVANQRQRFPEGIELFVWDDSSVELEGSLGNLTNNLIQGGFLVILVLGMFLRPSIAFWVAAGIPISFAGGLILMPWLGLSLNTMTLFGFIIAMGINVDDAIITSENVYSKLKEGMDPLEATVTGTQEIALPVTFGALTTIAAFMPLMFIDGFYGNFSRMVPPIVASVLLFSLIESKIVLPSHLKNIKTGRTKFNVFSRAQKGIADGLEVAIERYFRPALIYVTRHRYVTMAVFFAIALCSIGVISSGRLGFQNMPALDKNRIIGQVTMPRDTPLAITDERVLYMAEKAEQLKKEFVDPATGQSLITDVLTASGGWAGWPGYDARQGFVTLAVVDPSLRSEPGPKNSEIAKRWTELVGEFPDAQSVWIAGDRGDGFRGGGDDLESLEVELRGPASELRDNISDEIESILESYAGIQDAAADAGRSQNELHLTIRPEGIALGLTQAEVARQVRSAFYGEQAQRIQRGRDDVRVMVRLPLDQRQSLHTLEQMTLRTPDGGNAPFHSVVEARFVPARSDIRRINGAQVVSINAKPVDDTVDVVGIARDLGPRLDALIKQHPELSWNYDGYVAEHEETNKRLWEVGIGLFIAIYALLAVPFRSLSQPFLVMLAVPFGIIGALAGHMIRDITPSFLSIFGMLALAGVVINDSIVMVDFINQRRAQGGDLFNAVIDAGTRRFRAIMLTSLTSFAGLLPVIFDTSQQSQMLVPMAVSLGFGLLFSATITLFLVPSAFLVMEEILGKAKAFGIWYAGPFKRESREAEEEAVVQRY
ncbi:efflux RND transporter permease subunit [Luteolibacter flavescens]|uniref:Efflux RND transporter permease subunit n=1 Tax=Luteolibacter flavescens TaxID=1859460 RepID=A0ABT3FMQ2_9BACT|nr:efflux RND transporter permease subunit [Luteolibacter flavescens]MCW1884479.1 efflux RND transporter permease subunit [Luteolibacter flavescens]